MVEKLEILEGVLNVWMTLTNLARDGTPPGNGTGVLVCSRVPRDWPGVLVVLNTVRKT